MQLSNYTDGFFQINSKNGVLPLKEPLKKLPIKYADIQVIIDDLPRLKSDGTSGILENEGQIEERIANLKYTQNYFQRKLLILDYHRLNQRSNQKQNKKQ